jgi:ribonucleoside-diphosphate reductase alpha chain
VLLTQAPTGTTSLLSGVSSGIEPVFSFEYKRTDRTGEHIVYHPLYGAWKEAHPDEKDPDYFVSAMDLSPEEHLLVQAKVQEYTDSSISKTVNAPNDYTVEDVKRLYTEAYDLGCKGITFFRDGSRTGVLEVVKKEEKKVEDEKPAAAPEQQMPLPMSPEAGASLVNRPFAVHGATYKMHTPVGTAFVTINHDDAGEPLELFINVGKAGSDVSAMAEALGRTISTALRLRGGLDSREKAKEIADQLQGIGGRRSVGFGPNRILSLPDAVSVALAAHFGFRTVGPAYANGHSHLNGNTNGVKEAVDTGTQQMYMMSTEKTEVTQTSDGVTISQSEETVMGKQRADTCPECGNNTLIFEEGCAKCYSCGHSEC